MCLEHTSTGQMTQQQSWSSTSDPMFLGTKYTNETPLFENGVCYGLSGWHRSPVTKHQIRQVPSCQSHPSKFPLHCPHEHWHLPVENRDPQLAPLLGHHPDTPKGLGKPYCTVLSSLQLEIASLVHKREFQHTFSWGIVIIHTLAWHLSPRSTLGKNRVQPLSRSLVPEPEQRAEVIQTISSQYSSYKVGC